MHPTCRSRIYDARTTVSEDTNPYLEPVNSSPYSYAEATLLHPPTKRRDAAPAADSCGTCKAPIRSPCPRCTVTRWRCRLCTCLNDARSYSCSGCDVIREDAWQCLVCQQVLSLNIVTCQTCDVWRCQLCSTQNDARERESRNCKSCGQFRNVQQ